MYPNWIPKDAVVFDCTQLCGKDEELRHSLCQDFLDKARLDPDRSYIVTNYYRYGIEKPKDEELVPYFSDAFNIANVSLPSSLWSRIQVNIQERLSREEKARNEAMLALEKEKRRRRGKLLKIITITASVMALVAVILGTLLYDSIVVAAAFVVYAIYLAVIAAILNDPGRPTALLPPTKPDRISGTSRHTSYDITSNYIGKHGEFDRNDEDRAIAEDMYAMHSGNSGTDLQEHFGWENDLNYNSDGYDED